MPEAFGIEVEPIRLPYERTSRAVAERRNCGAFGLGIEMHSYENYVVSRQEAAIGQRPELLRVVGHLPGERH